MDSEPLALPAPDNTADEPATTQNHEQSGGRADGDQSARPGAASGQSRPGGRRPGRSAGPTYHSVEECLAGLSQLPGLVAMRCLSTSQANSIRAALGEILRWHGASQGGRDQQRMSDADLIAMVRANPALLDLLEPLLTVDQIEMVIREAGLEGNE